ncbi:MAG: hypothetical protein OZ932_13865, partial [Flavobacteriia bacterium]|nr:hypothetical protein [Flavobacteriia bacterium]
ELPRCIHGHEWVAGTAYLGWCAFWFQWGRGMAYGLVNLLDVFMAMNGLHVPPYPEWYASWSQWGGGMTQRIGELL